MPEVGTETVLRFVRLGDRLFIDPASDLSGIAMPPHWRVFASYLQERGLHWPAGGAVEPDGFHVPHLTADVAPDALEGLRDLHNEVDCRIEHGADSGGHLEYVRGRLAAMIESGSITDVDGTAASIAERGHHESAGEPGAMNADTREAVELLGLWYGRWQGFVVGTPARMHLRTRALLDKYGVHVHKDVKQR